MFCNYWFENWKSITSRYRTNANYCNNDEEYNKTKNVIPANKNLKMLYIKDNNDIEVYDVDTVMYEGNKYLSFKTSHFSNYVLATIDGETVNPNTGDSIVLYMIILALGVVGAILMTIILKKKKKID